MKIYGIQKLSLLDYPGKIACTLFTGSCNYLCPFCHNADLVLNLDKIKPIEESEIFDFLRKRRGMLEGVCITGGEPLLQPTLFDFIKRVKDMGYSIKLDTNGSKPKKLREIIDSGSIDYVAMDIKNSPQKYTKTVGLDFFNISDVMESASILMEGGTDYEFRTTVVNELHESSDFVAISNWLQGARQYFLQPYVDSENVIIKGYTPPKKDDLEEYLQILQRKIGSVGLRAV